MELAYYIRIDATDAKSTNAFIRSMRDANDKPHNSRYLYNRTTWNQPDASLFGAAVLCLVGNCSIYFLEPNPFTMLNRQGRLRRARNERHQRSAEEMVPTSHAPSPYTNMAEKLSAEHEVSAKGDSKPVSSRNWMIELFIIYLTFEIVYVLIKLGKRPDWTPDPPREGMSMELLTKKKNTDGVLKFGKTAEFQDLVKLLESVFENGSIDITCMPVLVFRDVIRIKLDL